MAKPVFSAEEAAVIVALRALLASASPGISSASDAHSPEDELDASVGVDEPAADEPSAEEDLDIGGDPTGDLDELEGPEDESAAETQAITKPAKGAPAKAGPPKASAPAKAPAKTGPGLEDVRTAVKALMRKGDPGKKYVDKIFALLRVKYVDKIPAAEFARALSLCKGAQARLR